MDAPAFCVSFRAAGFFIGSVFGLSLIHILNPESTLIMLVSALYGYEKTMAAYKVAVQERYRFFSFGDAMFIGNMKDDEKSK